MKKHKYKRTLPASDHFFFDEIDNFETVPGGNDPTGTTRKELKTRILFSYSTEPQKFCVACGQSTYNKINDKYFCLQCFEKLLREHLKKIGLDYDQPQNSF